MKEKKNKESKPKSVVCSKLMKDIESYINWHIKNNMGKNSKIPVKISYCFGINKSSIKRRIWIEVQITHEDILK